MALKEKVKWQLETDKNFLTSMLRRHGKVDANVMFEEQPGEELITLLMTDSEIQRAIQNAVEEFFGVNHLVSNMYICCGKRLITFTISKRAF